MKFLLDENAEFRLAAYLRSLGHNITTVAFDYSPGLSDRRVLAIAVRERRVLITNDRDFGELVVKEQMSHAGVIYFRLRLGAPIEEKIEWLKRLLSSHRREFHHFTVITESGIRTRRTTIRS